MKTLTKKICLECNKEFETFWSPYCPQCRAKYVAAKVKENSRPDGTQTCSKCLRAYPAAEMINTKGIRSPWCLSCRMKRSLAGNTKKAKKAANPKPCSCECHKTAAEKVSKHSNLTFEVHAITGKYDLPDLEAALDSMLLVAPLKKGLQRVKYAVKMAKVSKQIEILREAQNVERGSSPERP